MDEQAPRYLEQNSSQTLREALAEYYAHNQDRNGDLLDPSRMTPDLAERFRQHDAAHVVFGCDTSLRGETLIDTWTILATTAGLRGYLEYFKYPEVNQIFSDTGYVRIVLELLRCLPDLVRVWARSRQVTERWPWADYDRYRDQPLNEIRQHFDIRVV